MVLSSRNTSHKSKTCTVLSVEAFESRWCPAGGLSQSIANNMVTGLFRQMLHREPDGSGLNTFSQSLVNGSSVQQVVDNIWDSTEFRSQEATRYYQLYLGRNGNSAEVNGWAQLLIEGTPEAQVVKAFLTSSEFINLHSQNADFVAALCNDLLYRSPDTIGLSFWTNALNTGTSRADVVDKFLASNEYHTGRINSLYTAILGRQPDSAGVGHWQTVWNQPNVTIRNVETAFLVSDENVANLSTLTGVFLANPRIAEVSLNYTTGKASTHEIEEDPAHDNTYWISGQLHDAIVHFDANTGKSTFFAMPTGSRPHGITFDASGKLWVSLEFMGKVVQVDKQTGAILQTFDVQLNNVSGASGPLNTFPHDITIGADGKTIWFTGKSTGTVGKINPDGSVQHFQLPTVGSTPIYVTLGPDGNIWGTELTGNKIFRVTDAGVVSEFSIPSFNSRPIAIVAAPNDQPFLWFSEETTNNVAKIDLNGNITEFVVPKPQSNMIGAGLGFDAMGNLYAQSYVNQNSPIPSGPDFIIKLSKEILTAAPGDMSKVLVTNYQVPSTGTVFHRIILGDDGNMYFTELALDKVGKLTVSDSLAPQGYSFNLGV